VASKRGSCDPPSLSAFRLQTRIYLKDWSASLRCFVFVVWSGVDAINFFWQVKVELKSLPNRTGASAIDIGSSAFAGRHRSPGWLSFGSPRCESAAAQLFEVSAYETIQETNHEPGGRFHAGAWAWHLLPDTRRDSTIRLSSGLFWLWRGRKLHQLFADAPEDWSRQENAESF